LAQISLQPKLILAIEEESFLCDLSTNESIKVLQTIMRLQNFNPQGILQLFKFTLTQVNFYISYEIFNKFLNIGGDRGGVYITRNKYKAQGYNAISVVRVSTKVVGQLLFSSQLVEKGLFDVVPQKTQRVIQHLIVLSK
jgi:hypothetical protein